MNIVDGVVTKVLSDPTYISSFDVKWWQVEVEYNSWGTISNTVLVFPTFEQAYAVVEGYKFLA
jgi:hypothetical protein